MYLYYIFFFTFCLGPTLKKAAKGKLLDCFNNRRREYIKAGIITSTSRRSSICRQINTLPLHLNINSAGIVYKLKL